MARFERGPRGERREWDEMEFDYGWDYGPRSGRGRFRGRQGRFGPGAEPGTERGYGTRMGYGELGYGEDGYEEELGYDLEAGYGPRMGGGYEEEYDYEFGGRGWPYRERYRPRGEPRGGWRTQRRGPDEYRLGLRRPGYFGGGAMRERHRHHFGPEYGAEYGGGYREFGEFGETYGPEYEERYGGMYPHEYGAGWGGMYRHEYRPRWSGWRGGRGRFEGRGEGRRGQAMLGVMGGMMDRMEGRPGHTPSDRWPEVGHDVDQRPRRELELDDNEIREAVLENLFQDSWVDPQRIDVEVEDGVVTLSGEVSDFMEARYAWDDAWESAGVRGVVNHLTVRADQPQEGMDLPQTSGGE